MNVTRSHGHLPHLCQGQGAEAGRVHVLSQAETEGKQSQGGGYQPAEHEVPHTLLHQLHLGTGNMAQTGNHEASSSRYNI